MKSPSRTILCGDSGLNSAGLNAVFDQTWLALHARDERPDLLRFYRSRPAASIGRHQALDREIRVDYCCRRGIEIVRRASGGGALYVDEKQLGLSLIIRRPIGWAGLGPAEILAAFSRALADGLFLLGVDVRFKAPNDLEIAGRKLASTFVASEGDSLLLHATLLGDADIRTMMEALRVPTEKLTVTGLESARQRLLTLKELCVETPGDALLHQALRHGLASMLDAVLVDAGEAVEIGQGRGFYTLDPGGIDWSDSDSGALEALHKTPGGVLRLRLWPGTGKQRIERLQFAGDLHLHPADTLERLQRALVGLPLAEAEAAVFAFFASHRCDLAGFTADDICQVLQQALNRLDQQRKMGLSAPQANGLMLLGNDAAGILAQASVMLLPYCAKPAWCKWRHEDDCVECGKCEVGDAYRLARERNMQVTTITHYEHLAATLTRMKKEGVTAYVGACCSQFFIKRHHAFREAGMAALLMDISGANCYELKQEEAAYAGRFQAEARLDAELLERVMQWVPSRPDEQPQGAEPHSAEESGKTA